MKILSRFLGMLFLTIGIFALIFGIVSLQSDVMYLPYILIVVGLASVAIALGFNRASK